jgi:hypothetical protein
MIPIEWDANAAASQYLRKHARHHRQVRALHESRDSYLVRSELPASDPTTLPARMVGFLFSLREACIEQAVQEGMTFDLVIDSLIPGTGELWRMLERTRFC